MALWLSPTVSSQGGPGIAAKDQVRVTVVGTDLPVGPFPVAERLSARGLYLPSGLTLGDVDIHTVVSALRECLEPAERRTA